MHMNVHVVSSKDMVLFNSPVRHFVNCFLRCAKTDMAQVDAAFHTSTTPRNLLYYSDVFSCYNCENDI